MSSLLEVRGLGKTFSAHRALADVTFDVARGEAVALVGESGSGKSTTARVIARLTPPTEGSVQFGGARLSNRAFRARVQMIFQDPFASLDPIHTIGYHLARPLVIHKRVTNKSELGARVRALLEQVGLSAELVRKHPHQLSGGQRQRVAIARALAVDPELILADEPTSMLDASIRIGILNLLRDLKEQRGIALVFITHDLASARYLADRTLVMYAGHIVESGPSAEVMDAPKHPYTKLLLASLPDPLRPFTSAPISSPSKSGCPFASRCPEVHERCTSLPALHSITTTRSVRCHAVSASS
ncbi:MAG TPA: ABC transporter ATP-binding protein [Kofleriaceae bacterium]|nr:ABC transporter ATP-binding protein [Kofleriaceae bacterium]